MFLTIRVCMKYTQERITPRYSHPRVKDSSCFIFHRNSARAIEEYNI